MVTPESLEHYYGDVTRRLFMFGGLIMLIILPIYHTFLPLSVFGFIFAVLVISFIAGFTNPMQRGVMVFDILVSASALAIFEYHAITQFEVIPNVLFLAEQLIAIIFFFALYLSAKTLRGSMVSDFTVRERRREALRNKPPTSRPTV